MKIKHLAILLPCLFAAGLLGLIWCFWTASGPYVVETKQPLTLKEATHCPIDLPAEARNIQYAEFADWQILDGFVRFEAPVEVCKAQARSLIKHYLDTFHLKQGPDSEFQITPRVPPVSSRYFADLPWFDIEHLANALEIGGDHDLQPHIWIDQTRGIFYYHVQH
jgi:hypothetical protein